MPSFLSIICFNAIVVLSLAEPPLTYLGPHKTQQPLNAQSFPYQPLPQEQNLNNYGSPPSMYGAPEMIGDSYNDAYRQSSSLQHPSGYPNAPMETQVHKHIYVHVPPKDFEDEEMLPRVVHQVAPKQKHYKIVFIKAPSPPAVRVPKVPPPPQNEEKTLIYVLHKKPDSQPDIVIPTPAPTKPNKPEVFFIKYKTKKDEAPVYGPPPAPIYEIQSTVEPSPDYGSPRSSNNNGLISQELNPYESQITYNLPAISNETHNLSHQFGEDQTAEAVNGGHHIGSTFTGDENAVTDAESSNQYLPPDTTLAPIVVAEMEEPPLVPAGSYGTPNRYFIKRTK